MRVSKVGVKYSHTKDVISQHDFRYTSLFIEVDNAEIKNIQIHCYFFFLTF